jgi:CBS domain-containing protein
MTTLRRILAHKPEIYATGPHATVLEALKVMAEKNIGALVVVSGDQLVGIFSERDYARKVILRGKSSRDTPVREVMTSPVVTVGPHTTAEECMALMTERHIRHLPVLEFGRLVGVISIGDVVKTIVEQQQFTIQQLESYITGRS